MRGGRRLTASHRHLICVVDRWPSMRVLVVEDEIKMAALLRRGLTEQGLAVEIAEDGEPGVVLDGRLRGINAFEPCRQIRRNGIRAPVLMLTARNALDDRVAGLDGGADDYMVKPFALAQLLGR